MQLPELLLFTSIILFSDCTGQVDSLTIDPKTNRTTTTEICTDFQYPHCIESCAATLSFDTLKLVFHEETASTYDDLTIFVVNNKVFSKYLTVYMVLDTGATYWNPIKQDITLNTNKWSKNNSIYGKLDVEFKELHIDPSGNQTKTGIISFSGQFTAQIQ